MEPLAKKLHRIGRSHIVEVLEAVLVNAKAGDMQAAKLVLDRYWPVPRGGNVQLSLPLTRNAQEIREAMHQVIHRAASGQLSPADGETFIKMLRDTALIYQTETLPFSGPAIQITDARQSLADKITKALQAREATAKDTVIDVTPDNLPNAETPAGEAGDDTNVS